MPNGQIFPCPDMMYVPEMQQGDRQGNWLKTSPLQAHPDMPCRPAKPMPGAGAIA